MAKSIAKELAELQDKWENSEPIEGGGFKNKEDDIYEACKLTDASVTKSKSDNLMVVFEFTVKSGKYAGETINKYDVIQSEKNLSYFKGTCAVMGIEVPKDVADLPEVLEEFVKENRERFDLELKTEGDRQNIYVTVSGGVTEEEAPKKKKVVEEEEAPKKKKVVEEEEEPPKKKKMIRDE